MDLELADKNRRRHWIWSYDEAGYLGVIIAFANDALIHVVLRVTADTAESGDRGESYASRSPIGLSLEAQRDGALTLRSNLNHGFWW